MDARQNGGGDGDAPDVRAPWLSCSPYCHDASDDDGGEVLARPLAWFKLQAALTLHASGRDPSPVDAQPA